MRQVLERLEAKPALPQLLLLSLDPLDSLLRAAVSTAHSTFRKRWSLGLGIAIAAAFLLPITALSEECVSSAKGCANPGASCTISGTGKPGVCNIEGQAGLNKPLHCACGQPIQSNGPQTIPYDFNVSSNQMDPNGLPYNPSWSWQQMPSNQGQIPNTSTTCHDFSAQGGPDFALGAVNGGAVGVIFYPIFGIAAGAASLIPLLEPSFEDCTNQANPSTVDQPSYPNRLICEENEIYDLESNADHTAFSGHVNWFPITIEGKSFCCDYRIVDIGPGNDVVDHDYTFKYLSEAANEYPLYANDTDSTNRKGLHVEFDAQEVIDNFSLSKEWSALRNQVIADKNEAETLYQGHSILTGMFGLDGEHGLKVELHPLYAMAVRPDKVQPGPNEEMWLIFVRNRGDEGYCSSQLWDAGFEDYTFHLPWRGNADSVSVNWSKGKTLFWATPGASGPNVSVVEGGIGGAPGRDRDAGVYVKFHLGPAVETSESDTSVPLVFGALYLDWRGQSDAPPNLTGGGSKPATTLPGVVASKPVMPKPIMGTILPPDENAETGDVQDRLAAAMRKLTPAQRQQVLKAGAVPAAHPIAVHILPPSGPAKMLKELPLELKQVKPAALHAISAGPAVRKAVHEKAQMAALCAVTNNAPPGLPPNICNKNILGNSPAFIKPPDVAMPNHQ